MKTDIMIVGGGPCGLLVALLLGRLGVKTLLLEKHPQVLEHPKAMGVMRRTNEIFRQIGVFEKVAAASTGQHFDALSIWFRGSMTGQELGRAPIAEDPGHYSPCERFHCPQPHIEHVLREAVAAQPTVTSLFGWRADSFRQTDSSVVVAATDIGTGQQHSIEARYVVAADGDHSPIREALGIVRQGPGERGRFLSVYFKADLQPHIKGRTGLLCNVIGEDFFEGFVAINGTDLWLMHHYLDEGQQAQDFTEQMMHDIVLRAIGVPDLAITILSMNPWVMSPSVAPRWRDGRVFLVGDAAARVSPAGGLGMNNGLQSAHNLAWKLAHVIKGLAPEQLLDSYEQERLPAARFTFENSEGNSSEIFNVVTAALTGDWDKATELIRHSRRGGYGYGQDFGIVYESCAVTPDASQPQIPADVVNDYVPQARPGHRAPHFEVDVDGKRDSILSLLDYRYTALLGSDADPQRFSRQWPDALVLIDGRDFVACGEDWLALYGVSKSGAVLVRPDGYVGARVT